MNTEITVAVTAAISAILAALLTTVITQSGNRRLKTTELLFNARAEAYRDLIRFAANFPSEPTIEDTTAFDDICASALLFSSKRTQSKIAIYCALVFENDNSEVGVRKLAAAKKDAVLAMQKDLQKHKI